MKKSNPDDGGPPELSASEEDQEEQPLSERPLNQNDQPHSIPDVEKKQPILKIQLCDSAENFKQGDSSSDDDNRREIVSNDSDEDLDLDNENERQKRRNVTEDRLEEVSEQGSELFETDSSCNEGQEEVTINQDGSGIESPIMADGEGKDIVAGSPTRVGRKVDEDQLFRIEGEQAESPKEEQEEDVPEQKGREEMNGTIVYDSYAKLTGCEKIVQYFLEKETKKLNQSVLFPKDESKEVVKEFFQEKAKERDFPVEYDRYIYRNLPKFLPQRDFERQQFEIYVPQQQNVLIFDSRFENGNLRKVAKVNNIEYNLWLENDLNTKGHTQWYYFKVIYKDIVVRADKKSHKIKFSILNLAKTSSLYQVGMKPLIWSKRKNQADGTEWIRGGEDITYVQNDIPRYSESQGASYGRMQVNENNNNAFLYNSNGAGEGTDYYYTFSFKYEFEPNTDDEIWFAHAVPSTYTDMQEKLVKLRHEAEYQSFLKMNILCLTLAKNPVPLLTITENVGTYLDYYEELRLQAIPGIVRKAFRQKYTAAQKLAKQSDAAKGRVQRLLQAALDEELKQFIEFNESHLIDSSPKFAGFGQRLSAYVREHSKKKTIFITSRVHPGEPQASHMLDGLIKYILSPEAEQLRKHFVFRIVPMLNPDGVIYGNYRCSLLGCDLNRKWDKPNKFLHPPVFFSKMLIRHMHAERKVLLYCDLHGHSRKKNAFFYGCSYKNYEQEGRVKNAHVRLIPLLCCQKNELFKLKDCRFRMEHNKQSTARCVVFKEFNIQNSFTLESSFYAKEEDKKANKTNKKQMNALTIQDYNSMGHTLIQIINNFLPSQQYKLQFLSGQILDVFYDEFIKFVPPYILKREEERRKKAEEGQVIPGQKSSQMRKGFQSKISNTMGETPSVSQLQRRQSQIQQTPQHTGLQNLHKADTGKLSQGLSNEFGPILNNKKGGSNQRAKENAFTQQSEFNVIDEDGQTQFVKCPESPNSPQLKGDDILELESFMKGVQSNIRRKEAKKLAKKQQKIDGSAEFSELSSLSGDSSGEDFNKKKRKKKKANQTKMKAGLNHTQNSANILAQQSKKKSAYDVSKNDAQLSATGASLKRPSNSNVTAAKQSSYNNKVRSPRNFELVAPVLAKKASRQQIAQLTQPKEQVMSSQQIQMLIQNQIQSGVLNQSEILSEIQKAIVHNQKVLTSGLINQMQGDQQQPPNPQQQQDQIHLQQAAISNMLNSFNTAQQQPIKDSRQKHRSTTTTFVMPNIEQDKAKHHSLIISPNKANQQHALQQSSSTNERRSNKKDTQGQIIANTMYQNAVASAEDDGMISPNFLGKKPSNRIYSKKNAQHESLPMIPATNSQLKSYNLEQKSNYLIVQQQQVSSSMQQYNTSKNQINVHKAGSNYPQSAPMSDADLKDVNKVKSKFIVEQASNPSINMEINLNSTGQSIHNAPDKHHKKFSYEPLDEVPFKNHGIKSKLENDFPSQLQRGEQNVSYRTQKIQKDFKISRNIQNPNQQIHLLPGTFDSGDNNKQGSKSNDVSVLHTRNSMVEKNNNQVLAQQDQMDFNSPNQPSRTDGTNFKKSEFKNNSMVQSIKNSKKIKPILGLKNVDKQNPAPLQMIVGSQNQEMAQRFNQHVNDQMGLSHANQNHFMSPQGQLRGNTGIQHQTQIGFLHNNQYQIAKKRQEAMEKLTKNQKQEAKELFISGTMGRPQGVQDQYRRSSAGYDSQNQGYPSPLLPPASKKNLQADMLENKNTLQIVDMTYNKNGLPQQSQIGSITEKVQRHMQKTSGMNQAQNMKMPVRQSNHVMADLQDEIAKETASMDLIQKQKQLQIQLEKQQKLLQQLQTQLNQQNGGRDGQNTTQQMKNQSYRQTQGQMLQHIPKEFVNFEAIQYNGQGNAQQTQSREKSLSMSQEWSVPFVSSAQERGHKQAKSKNQKYPRSNDMNNNMNYQYKNNDHKQYNNNNNNHQKNFYKQGADNIAQTRLQQITENTSNDFSNPTFSSKMLGSAPKTPHISKNNKLDNKTSMQLSHSEFVLNDQQMNNGQKGNNKMMNPQSQRWNSINNQKQKNISQNMQHQQINNRQLNNDQANDQNNEHQGISVANYVQNINVFVSENTQGAGRSIGLGIGQGIAGGLGNSLTNQTSNMNQQYSAQINQNDFVLQDNIMNHHNQAQKNQNLQRQQLSPRKQSNQKGGIQMSQIQPLIQNQDNKSVVYGTRNSVNQLGQADPAHLVLTPTHKKPNFKAVNQTQLKFNGSIQNNNLMSPVGQYRGNPKLQ